MMMFVTGHNSIIEIPKVVVVGTTALVCVTVCTAVGKPPGPRQGLWSLTCQCSPLDPDRGSGL